MSTTTPPRLYIGHISDDIGAAEISDALSNLTTCEVELQERTYRGGKTSRFGFVTVSSESDLKDAMELLRKRLGDGVQIDRAQPKPIKNKEPKAASKSSEGAEPTAELASKPLKKKTTKVSEKARPKKTPVRGPTRIDVEEDAVYVELPPKTKKAEVLKLFTDFSNVRARVIFRPPRRIRRGDTVALVPARSFAIVTVGKENQERAIQSINGREFEGHPLVVKAAERRVPVESADIKGDDKTESSSPETVTEKEDLPSAGEVSVEA